MAEIGLDFDGVLLDFSSSEQHEAAYLKLNPDGVVPTLVDDGMVVVESSLILEYLDRHYNGGDLMPKERVLETQARHWLLRTLSVHAAINTLTFSTAGRDKTLASKTPEQISEAIMKMPDPVAQIKRRDLLEHGLGSVYVAQACGQLKRTFTDMDAALEVSDWITGPVFGIADIALLSYIDRLERLGFAGLWDGSTPRIGAWLARMQARPSYEAAIGAYVSAQAAAETRQSGEVYWPDLQRLWTASGT